MKTPKCWLKKRPTSRTGFTIVELLVSLALVIFIMSLVSTVFVLATKSFRDMKAVGDLAEQLRSAGQIIRETVKANHFGNGLKVSDDSFWLPKNSSGLVGAPWNNNEEKDPLFFTWREGFLRLDQATAPTTANIYGLGGSQDEGKDLDNIPLFRSDQNQDYRLSMSVILDGKSPSNLFTANFGSGGRPAGFTTPDYRFFESATLMRRSRAECVFFLAKQDPVDAPQTALLSDPTNGKTLYSLNLKTWLIGETSEIGIATTNSTLSYDSAGNFNDISKVSSLQNRRSYQFFQAGNPAASRFAATDGHPDLQSLILRNVVSFQVTLLGTNGAPFILQNSGFYDTALQSNWTAATNAGVTTYTPVTGSWRSQDIAFPPATNAKVTGVKIIIRVYDPDNEITRQMTIVEPL